MPKCNCMGPCSCHRTLLDPHYSHSRVVRLLSLVFIMFVLCCCVTYLAPFSISQTPSVSCYSNLSSITFRGQYWGARNQNNRKINFNKVPVKKIQLAVRHSLYRVAKKYRYFMFIAMLRSTALRQKEK